jgi:phosphate starvation-inducible PhoH-like protein
LTAPSTPVSVSSGGAAVKLEFDDNTLLIQLFGSHHAHLARIEHALDVSLNARGNVLTVIGDGGDVNAARAVLDGLYRRLKSGMAVGREDVDAALRMAVDDGVGAIGAVTGGDDPVIRTRKRHISPRSPIQAAYIQAIDDAELVFGLGPAGTGKTYLAVAKAVEKLVGGEVDRIILSRPAVEAGEQLGFLPGDMREKVDPYLRPIYDALHDMLPTQQVAKRLENGEIEVAPLAFMRGRTLANAFVILDEAQNTSAVQMKMFLTRLGENSRMVVTGDLSQVDLPRGMRSGLRDAVEILEGNEAIAVVRFTDRDVVRHPLVSHIVRAYEAVESQRGTGARYQKDGAEPPRT